MTLDEARKLFEADFTSARVGPAAPFTEKGTRYIVVTVGGVKREGEMTPCYATSEHAAASAWLLHARQVADFFRHNMMPGPAHLLWRHQPMLETRDYVPAEGKQHEADELRLFSVYSRLAVE